MQGQTLSNALSGKPEIGQEGSNGGGPGNGSGQGKGGFRWKGFGGRDGAGRFRKRISRGQEQVQGREIPVEEVHEWGLESLLNFSPPLGGVEA